MFLEKLFRPRKVEENPVKVWAIRSVNRAAHIFNYQGYNGRIGKIIPGYRHIIIPVYPPIASLAKDPAITKKMLSLSDPIGVATNTRCYAEWVGNKIYYYLEKPPDYWNELTLSQIPKDVIGLTEYKKEISYTFDETYPHSLVAGATGSGKSVALETILFYLIRNHDPEDLALIIIDPHDSFGRRKDQDLGTFDRVPHLIFNRIAKSKHEITEQLTWVLSELIRRKSIEDRVPSYKRIVIIGDELASQEFVGRDSFVDERLLSILRTLGAEARKYKINLILGTQKPEETDNNLFDHLNYRFLGKVSNNQLGTRILGRPGFKSASLSGSGDFFVSSDNVLRFQFALPERVDFESLPRVDLISQPSIINMDIGSVESSGRPYSPLDMEKLAFYLYYGPDNISIADASILKPLQLGRILHNRYKGTAKEVISHLLTLKRSNVPLGLVDKVS